MDPVLRSFSGGIPLMGVVALQCFRKMRIDSGRVTSAIVLLQEKCSQGEAHRRAPA
jgi:hypothetical protein